MFMTFYDINWVAQIYELENQRMFNNSNPLSFVKLMLKCKLLNELEKN